MSLHHPNTPPILDNHFRRFCELMQEIADTRGSKRKTQLFAGYLQSLEDDDSLALAARFAGEGAFSSVSGRRASVGSRTIGVCAASFCEIDYDLVFRACRTATGSASEAIEKLMENLPAARKKMEKRRLSLQQVSDIFEALENARKRVEKEAILHEAWQQMSPLEVKYFIRVMGQGSLRIGFEARSISAALALAFDQDTEAVRYARMITGSLEKTALLCKRQRLAEAQFQLFQPIAFMLASPLESRKVEHITEYIAEEKFDGMRCQLHVSGEKVALFSRDLNEITNSFPEVVEFFSGLGLPPLVLDGELCVFKHDTIQPFASLQKRMGLKKPSQKAQQQMPVVFIAYDVLFEEGEPLFGLPLHKRRKRLEQRCDAAGIRRSYAFSLEDEAQVEEYFERALAHGNEGLMLKHKESTYEYGQRRKSWLKVKQPGGTLDTVIMYAHAGSGKRGGTYSDFTLGISVRDDERYEEAFIPIGKAYGGYTDEELKQLNKAMKPLIVERFGPTYSLKPGIMVEIEFDDIQLNKRTKAGYTLRFPRFKAIRWDLAPSDADTLGDVERLFEAKQNRARTAQRDSEHRAIT
ncbi:MAG: ATP-dependent DNA ligase [Cyclonatronaceae bacterium]